MQKINQWHQFKTAAQVADIVCEQILQSAHQAIAERGQFHIVLAGGSTPEKIYQQLATAKTDWSKWVIYYGDERCLPADDKDRNSIMADHALLSKVAIPEANIFTMPTEMGAVDAAKEYRLAIAGVDQFDLVLLGMGEDGHTASLFPDHQNDLEETVHEIYNSPKPPSDRISLSAKTLANTRQLFFIVTGESKQIPVRQWKQGGEGLPIATISPDAGVDIYIDSAAIG